MGKVLHHLFNYQLSCLCRLEPFSANKDGARSVASSETAVQESVGNERSGNQTAMRLRSFGSRRVFVKDTAFQT
jgi:hypothetical protein